MRLSLRWSTSRALGYEGQNVVTITDNEATGRQRKRFTQTGGNYNLEAAALSEWLQTAYQKELRAIGDRAGYVFGGDQDPESINTPVTLHGLYRERGTGAMSCNPGGTRDLEKIAEAIGLRLQEVREGSRRPRVVGYVVEEKTT
jgi:hypothetical protein